MTATDEYIPTNKEKMINRLQVLLKELIEAEDYENCAKVRDRLKELEKK